MNQANLLLGNVDLFVGVERKLVQKTGELCIIRQFGSDETVFSQGDPPGGVYFLIEGGARASIFTYSGKNVVFKDINPGMMFGEIGALDGSPRASTLETVTASKVACLSTEAFVDLMHENRHLMLRVCGSLAADARQLTSRVVEFSTLTVHNRIHAELLRLASVDGDKSGEAIIRPIPTLADIANRISTHREAVSRELSRLTKDGLLKRENGQLVITDILKLKKLVREAAREKSLI